MLIFTRSLRVCLAREKIADTHSNSQSVSRFSGCP